MPAAIPESLRVFIPSAQSHSPLCSFAAGINTSQIFRLCVNKHFLTASNTKADFKSVSEHGFFEPFRLC